MTNISKASEELAASIDANWKQEYDAALVVIKALVRQFGNETSPGVYEVKIPDTYLFNASTEYDLVALDTDVPRGRKLTLTDRPGKINKYVAAIQSAFLNFPVPTQSDLEEAIKKAFGLKVKL